LGSAIAALIQLQRESEIDAAQIQFFAAREQIAKILLSSSRFEVDALVNLLLEEANATATNLENLHPERQFDSKELTILEEYSKHTFSWLSLTILYADNWILLREVITQYYLKLEKSVENAELEEDILIWSYTFTILLNNNWETNELNFSQLIKQVLADLGVEKTALCNQLKIVVKAVERGISLQELFDTLLPKGNYGQEAIALSFYCFATTPFDFRLSVQRAANLMPEIARLTTTLTGTLSGAYNGMTRIPLNWRKMANRNSAYPIANQTILELFKVWLGIHPAQPINDENIELQAIAVPNLIQPRKSLTIISQKLPFNF
jgi:hypothetical protein